MRRLGHYKASASKTSADQKRATLFTMCGEECFKLIRSDCTFFFSFLFMVVPSWYNKYLAPPFNKEIFYFFFYYYYKSC